MCGDLHVGHPPRHIPQYLYSSRSLQNTKLLQQVDSTTSTTERKWSGLIATQSFSFFIFFTCSASLSPSFPCLVAIQFSKTLFTSNIYHSCPFLMLGSMMSCLQSFPTINKHKLFSPFPVPRAIIIWPVFGRYSETDIFLYQSISPLTFELLSGAFSLLHTIWSSPFLVAWPLHPLST